MFAAAGLASNGPPVSVRFFQPVMSAAGSVPTGA